MKYITVADPPVILATEKVKWPIRFKITLPYLILAVVVATGVTLLFSRIVMETVDERFNNQLYESGKLASEAMLTLENEQVETLRLLANTEGVADALISKDAEKLRSLALGVTVNNQAYAVEYLDQEANLILAIRQKEENGTLAYEYVRGGARVYQDWKIVQKVLEGKDNQAQKYSDLIQADWGTYLYLSGPVKNNSDQVVGVTLVGVPLTRVAQSLREATLAQITIYDLNGVPVSSSFPNPSYLHPINTDQVKEILSRQDEVTFRRDSTNQESENIGLDYGEILGPWESRDGNDLGMLGTSLVKNVLITASLPTRLWMVSLVFLTVLLIILIGFNLSNFITKPLIRLMQATHLVASGELQVVVKKETNDEIAVLADSFNVMIQNLQQSHNEMVTIYDSTLEGWAKILELRDKETSGHSQRVVDLTMSLAPLMGIPEEQMENLHRGVLLHDIGKLGVPDSILLKPDELTKDEWTVMRKHPEYAFEMLKNIPYLATAVEVPYCHHEWWNGKGYPRQLIGESIPLTARVFTIVDAWDAIITDRPYRKKLTPKEALTKIQNQSGLQFDPRLVNIFTNYIETNFLGLK